MGGGGFSMEPENLLLDRYVLSAAEVRTPKVCFVGTASGDAETYLDKFYAAFRTLESEPTHLSLFKPPTADLQSFVMEQDVIYVGGGNTRNLLVLWREWGLRFNSARSMAGGCGAGRDQRGIDLLVQAGAERFGDPRRPGAAELPGISSRQQLSALRWRAGAQACLSPFH